MSLGGILFLVVAVVALFAFIYLIVVTARGWGVLQTIMLCLLFIECWSFLFFSAGVLDKRLRWLSEANKQSKQADDLEKKTQQLLWGSGGGSGELPDALIPVSGELRRLTFDRGRVWRGASLEDQQNGEYRLRLTSAKVSAPADPTAALDPSAPAAPAPAPVISAQSLPESMVVYGFSQVEDEAGRSIPDRYLGEFTVVKSAGDSVTIRPTLPLEANQAQWIQSGEASAWTLYELLPLDAHETFTAVGSTPNENEAFGRMDRETLEKLFANIPEENGRRQRIVDSYARDGQKAEDSDPPRTVWARVKLNKEYTIDVDSKEDANATVGGYFDMSGRTVDVRLKRGDEPSVTIAQDRELIVDERSAADMVAKGIGTITQRIYVRPLNAYERAFSRLNGTRDEANKRTLVFQREASLLQDANQIGQAMISERQVENTKLTADYGQYQRELEFITQQAQAMVSQFDQAKQQFDQTRAQILDLQKKIYADYQRLAGAEPQ